MKYFAVETKNSSDLLNYLIDMRVFPLPKFYSLTFAHLYENTLSDEDYTVIRLKFKTINPTRAQLVVAQKLHKITLNMDEYPIESLSE
jgi:hypothetical protein